jgi:hypothetical protein
MSRYSNWKMGKALGGVKPAEEPKKEGTILSCPTGEKNPQLVMAQGGGNQGRQEEILR